jgi:hypothetical protein
MVNLYEYDVAIDGSSSGVKIPVKLTTKRAIQDEALVIDEEK